MPAEFRGHPNTVLHMGHVCKSSRLREYRGGEGVVFSPNIFGQRLPI